MEITGVVKLVGETMIVSDKFKKRDLVITTEETYPQHISLQVTQDKVSMLDSLPLGTSVTAYINIRGREWTSPQGEVKHFNTIECWRLEVGSTGEKKEDVAHQAIEDEGNGLPF